MLERLVRHYHRPFADRWDFVDYVRQHNLGLDLTTPLARYRIYRSWPGCNPLDGRPRIGYPGTAGLQYAALFSLLPVYKKVYEPLEGAGLQIDDDIGN